MEIQSLDPRDARLFACDCAEHVLPLYERAFAGDDRPHRAIQAARELAGAPKPIIRQMLRDAPFRALDANVLAAQRGALKLSYRRGRYRQMTALAAIASAAHYCLYTDPHFAAQHAMDMAAEAVRMLNKPDSDAEQIERAWQADQMHGYLMGTGEESA